MRFLYDQYHRYRETGLKAYKEEDFTEARYNLLMAAECLYKMAHYSNDELRTTRIHSAKKLVDLAKSIFRNINKENPKQISIEEHEESQKPSRFVMTQKPGIGFADIAGLEEVKETIRRRVLYPFMYPEAAARYKKRAGGGVLLYGPPGTGKTMLAKAIASELEATFFSIKCSDIMSKWVGEAESNLKQLFQEAREQNVAVIFLDETEALVAKRGGDSTVMKRVIPEFLAQVDGVDTKASSLLILGATNRPWDIDEAALRPGRFDELIYIGLPDREARQQILQTNLEQVPSDPEIQIEKLVEWTEGLTGADIVGFLSRATDYPYSREVSQGASDKLTLTDVEMALQQTHPSVSETMLQRYKKFRQSRT